MGRVTKRKNDKHQYPSSLEDFIANLEGLEGVEAVGKGKWFPYPSNGFMADVKYLDETERTIKVVARHEGFQMDFYVRLKDVNEFLTPVMHYVLYEYT